MNIEEEEAEISLGGEVVHVLCRSTWAEGYDHEGEGHIINSPDALHNQSVFKLIDSVVDIDKEFDNKSNNIGGKKWFMKIETTYGPIAYITDNYPMFFMLETDYNKLIK